MFQKAPSNPSVPLSPTRYHPGLPSPAGPSRQGGSPAGSGWRHLLGAARNAIRVCVVAGLWTAATAHGASWYVNGACKNNGNGAADTCASAAGTAGAWQNVTNITSSPKPGDIINIHGAPTYPGNYSTGQSYWNLPSGLNGTPGNPVIIQNAPGESVKIDGAADIHGAPGNWTAVGNGVYRCSAGLCATENPGASVRFPVAIWYALPGGPEQVLNLDMGPTSCTSSLPAGFFSYGSAGPVCAHLADGSNPGAAQYLNMPYYQVGLALNNYSTHDVTLRVNGGGAHPSGSFAFQRFVQYGLVLTTQQNTNVTVDGLDIGYVADRCITAEDTGGSNPSALVFTHNHLHHCGQEGIHDFNDSGAGVIAWNEIDHIQALPWFQQCFNNKSGGCNVIGFNDKCTGVRFGSSSTLYLHDNYLHDNCGGYSGAGYDLDCEVSCGSAAKPLIVENNYSFNMTQGPDANNRTVSFFIQGAGPYYVKWQNNRSSQVDYCISIDDISGPNVISYQNNTCTEMRYGGLYHYGGNGGSPTGSITLSNNIFYARVQHPNDLINVDPSAWPSFVVPDHNALYCALCSGTIVNYKGSTYTSATVAGLGRGNVYGDPNLVNTGTPPALRIASAGGSAYQTGAALAPAFPDALGTARPASGSWDLGAIQYPGTGTHLIPPTNLRIVP